MTLKPLLDRIVCLSELSKDLKGELRPMEAERQVCRRRDCVTLETVHQLVLDVASHDCDSEAGKLLDGRLGSQVVSKFVDGDGNRRGVHEGPFRWRAPDLLATGMMKGVTNVGTHRRPAFDDCQTCKDRGVMEGMLLGTIVRARNKRLLGCELRAAYRLRFDPSESGGSGAVAGTLEGAIVCDCRGGPQQTCIDFSAMPTGSGPNPRVEQGVSFTVHDFAGTPTVDTRITTMGSAFTGLDVGFRTEIVLPAPCTAVEATLVHLSQPAQLEAFESGGGSAGALTMTVGQNVAETLRITGSSIDRAVIVAPQDETLLLRFCFETA
jgi:hypothetical protein